MVEVNLISLPVCLCFYCFAYQLGNIIEITETRIEETNFKFLVTYWHIANTNEFFIIPASTCKFLFIAKLL